MRHIAAGNRPGIGEHRQARRDKQVLGHQLLWSDVKLHCQAACMGTRHAVLLRHSASASRCPLVTVLQHLHVVAHSWPRAGADLAASLFGIDSSNSQRWRFRPTLAEHFLHSWWKALSRLVELCELLLLLGVRCLHLLQHAVHCQQRQHMPSELDVGFAIHLFNRVAGLDAPATRALLEGAPTSLRDSVCIGQAETQAHFPHACANLM